MESGTSIKKALLHVPDMPTSDMHEKASASWPGWVTVIT